MKSSYLPTDGGGGGGEVGRKILPCQLYHGAYPAMEGTAWRLACIPAWGGGGRITKCTCHQKIF